MSRNLLTVDYPIRIVVSMKGEELRRLRRQLGLTQVEMAERLGVAANTVARWERNEMSINEPAARLARFLVETERPKGKRRS